MATMSLKPVVGASPPTPFPFVHLVPKTETNVLKFLEKYPNYNGKNVIIGILDTGVDPGAHGLQTCAGSDSAVKLLDIVDCTGAGDVELFDATAIYDEECKCYKVTGLSGRTLQLSAEWKFEAFPVERKKAIAIITKEEEDSEVAVNEDDSPLSSEADDATSGNQTNPKSSVPVRLGIKAAYQLLPPRLLPRIKAARKKQLDAKLQVYLADVQSQLADCQVVLSKEKTDSPRYKAAYKLKQELDARAFILQDSSWSDEDPGQVHDCLVFYDGANYRAILDVDESGDLTKCKPMTDFDKEYQYECLSTESQMNFGVHFYEDGRVLSVVNDCSPHGTHVASIAAGNDGERSGVAPGAQVVSFVFGDLRLGTTETGTAFARCMAEAVRHKCDVINMSFGDYFSLPNMGRLKELADELVWKHNIVFVASAGNEGPALSTTGAPGGSYSSIISVGAFVSPNMLNAMYSLMPADNDDAATADVDDKAVVDAAGTNYTWSSRGPTYDGDWGVDVTAPGGAITSVSNWTLQKSQLMNGTSMSSPHATGCVALLISACKAEGIPVSPARIRKALFNTAYSCPNMSAPEQGRGLIQVDKAFEYLQRTKDCSPEDLFLEVTVSDRPGRPRGIYLRQEHEVSIKQSYNIHVEPHFRRENMPSDDTQRKKIEFELAVGLTSSEQWVKVPPHFMLMCNGREFKIDVDPTGLEPGLHTAVISGFVADDIGQSTMFDVPITVVKPLPTEPFQSWPALKMQPTSIKRFFLTPPFGSTWMDVTLKDCREGLLESAVTYVHLHSVQVIEHSSHRDYAKNKRLAMRPGQTVVTSIAVEENVTVEIAVASGWSTTSAVTLNASVEFRGVRPVPNVINAAPGAKGYLVRISSDMKDEVVKPAGQLTKWSTLVAPKEEGVIRALSDRDMLTFASGDATLPGDGKKPGGFHISYTIGPKESKRNCEPSPPDHKDERPIDQKLLDAVRDTKIEELEKLSGDDLDQFDALFEKLLSDYPDHVPLHVAKLKYLDGHKEREQKLLEVVTAAEAVASLIPLDALAQYFGRRTDTDDPILAKKQKEANDKKSALVDALARMALAYVELGGSDSFEKFQQTLKRLQEWVDIDTSDKYAILYMERESRSGNFGLVLKTLNKLLDSKEIKDSFRPLSKAVILKKRAAALEKLGYDALVEYSERSRMIACPKAFALF